MSHPPARPPGFFEAAAIVAAKDLRIEGRTFETLAAMAMFALVELVVFSFAFGPETIQRLGPAKVVPGLLWMTLAFSAIVGFTRSFRIERAREALIAVALAPIDRGAVFVGKWIANFALLAVLEAIVIVLTAIFFNVDILAVILPLAGVVLLHSVGLAALGTLFGAVVSRLGRGEALLATLLLPAAIPLILSAVQCTASVLEGNPLSEIRIWLLLTAGFDILYVLVPILIFDAILGGMMQRAYDWFMTILLGVTAVLMAFALYLIFVSAPEEKVMGAVQKIFYFHVPIAMVTFLSVFVLLLGAIGYLWTRQASWDRLSVASAEVGLVFCTLVLITGPIWAKPAWGVWWTWEAKLTTTLILWLLLAGILLARAYASSPEQGARVASVLGVVAALDVPIVYKAVDWWRGQHPIVFGAGKTDPLAPGMRSALLVSMLVFVLLYTLLVAARMRLAALHDRLAALEDAAWRSQ